MVAKPIERIDLHKDGSIKAKGSTINDVLTGYWEWFRTDGTKIRSGYFENGNRQVNGRPMTPREKSSKSRG
jgi:hypothetical protein